MKIGIVGAGSMGITLARHLVKLGHDISIASPRGSGNLVTLATEIAALGVSLEQAIDAAEVVILAIPTKVLVHLPRVLFANSSSSTLVIDVGNYHPELRDGRIEAIDQGLLDSQWVAQQIGHPVVKAFNNIFATSLLKKGAACYRPRCLMDPARFPRELCDGEAATALRFPIA